MSIVLNSRIAYPQKEIESTVIDTLKNGASLAKYR